MLKPSTSTSDPAYDILRTEHQPLSAIFEPQTVAVIGATDREGSVGRTILWNLISNPFGGTIFPVNPKRKSVMGIRAYAAIRDVPETVDLAVIVTPAPTVPGLIKECIEAGVQGAIIISAGFREAGPDGVALEQQIQQQLQQSTLRLIGPNCLGVMSPRTGLNATFASSMARPGNVGFISQSGALCTAVLDWSFRENVGFSAFISLGSMLDVDWGDLVYHLGDDPHTHSIVIYMESIGDARSFLSAAREVAMTKPIIVIKAGRTDAAAKASASHTGALTGSDEVIDAAFRRCGVLRVNRISELFNMAEVLGKASCLPKGPNLTIITNAGGPGVLATDALIATGGGLATLAEATTTALNQVLPAHWSHNNPVDILGDATPERYTRALDIVAQDPASDGILVVLTPQAMTDPTQTAEHLKAYVEAGRGKALKDKPVLASWMGGAEVMTGETILNRASIPTYPYPDSAARVFNFMWQYSYNLRGIYETPMLPPDRDDIPHRAKAEEIIATVRQGDRTLLTEAESKQLLAAYGIPTVSTQTAYSEAEAVTQAEQMGYPVVLKLLSDTITHKTDVGGVRLNLGDEVAVQKAYREIAAAVAQAAGPDAFQGVTVQPMIDRDGGYELIIGSSVDPQFGPVLVFGSGGQLVEVFKDRAIALPPLNTTLARRLVEHTKIYKALQGVRGRQPVDLPALEELLVRFSQLVVEQPWIREIDINPLLASSERLLALDARVVLHGPEMEPHQLPRTAIRPYPTQYVVPWTLTDGTPITIRPIRPEDEPLIVQFHQTLSEESVYFRYFHLMKLSQRVAHERLTRICFIDYDREMALVADYQDPTSGQHKILAVGRLSKLHNLTPEAEFAMLVSDPVQQQGLGTELLRRLISVGRDEHLARINAEILADNKAMQRVCEKLGFRLQRAGSDLVQAVIDL